MGFKARVVGKAAKALVEEGLLGGAVSLMDNTRSVEALLERRPTGYKLIIRRERRGLIQYLGVYDENSGEKKYNIKSAGKHVQRLYNLEGIEIGKVEQDKSLLFRDVDYDMYLHGKSAGTAHQKVATKVKIEISKQDWFIESGMWGALVGDYKVLDKHNQLVMKIRCAVSDKEAFVIEYENEMHEEIGLLILMVLNLFTNEK